MSMDTDTGADTSMTAKVLNNSRLYVISYAESIIRDLITNLSCSTDYFDSYSHWGIHEEMLKDEVRTLSYRDAIMQNPHLFRGKVVLDVGCGTGILSMFCAKAGAKHVYGIDMSNIIDKAKEIVKVNGLDDRVTLLKGKMEDIQLPVAKVDIIVSEWMGYFLLYESMLDTVLYARDRYLAEDGLLFPDHARILVAAIEDSEYKEEKIGFWDDVYGFDFSPIKEDVWKEPLVDTVEAHAVNTNTCTVLDIDLKTVKKEDLSFQSSFQLTATRNDFIHGFLAWFDIDFSACHKPVHFSTGPFTNYTHWKQTVFYTRKNLTIKAGETLSGTISCKPAERNHRDLDINLSYTFNPTDSSRSAVSENLFFRMC
ncbi:type I protein arginine N-methyltransferase Rmt1 [Schizosaccharomyces japonicus yFS275]|uniref:type I protein arginine methyltransferase n=1 Tax=Schizosaccharomyces japonicus (strain yFS275 / FY16936) TaxID=402676 RepID=B6K134_SCHJY|nr:type I protein arginine N-methyltransferase Rmt1 [Schizosaccharomyces japonicus yFS275]EEB07655.2 type I protein arginine N-methyltransferase Rmt1 [Schizosaccharomyces japonicus yFS275]